MGLLAPEGMTVRGQLRGPYFRHFAGLQFIPASAKTTGSYISSAYLKGRKLVFLRSVREFVAFAELRRMKTGSIKTARELMDLDSVMFGDDGDSKKLRKLNLGSQIATFFRFLEGPGKRLTFLKGQDFLVAYMQAVIEVAAVYLNAEACYTV